MLRRLLFALLMLATARVLAQPPAPPAPQQPSAALRAGGEEVVALLKGEAQPAALLTAEFLAAVPEVQTRAADGQLCAQYGALQRLPGAYTASPVSGTIHIRYEL